MGIEPALTTAEVMKVLKIKDRDTLYSLVKSKRLRAVRLGREYRFDPQAVRDFLDPPDYSRPPRKIEQPRRAPSWMAGVRKVIVER